MWAVCAFVLSRQSTAFSSKPYFTQVETQLYATADEDGNELLKKAAALREEANRLEESLKANRPAKTSNSTPSSKPKAPPITSYKSMKDSTWTLTYRFADRPESRDVTSPFERNLYNGKLTVIFLNDGYSEVVRHESTNVKVQKVWGWDVERSNDDDNDYLLFSVDFVLPSIGKERFYFQARKSVDGIGNISLAEGTITVKQDVVDSKASRWSLFSPRGILAEFRAVGEFIGKPSTAF